MTEITNRKKNMIAINTHLSILKLNVNELIKKRNQSFVDTRESSYLPFTQKPSSSERMEKGLQENGTRKQAKANILISDKINQIKMNQNKEGSVIIINST